MTQINAEPIDMTLAEILHEIRNPLTTVKGFLQLVRPQLREQCDGQYLQFALEELDRCNDLITTFLDERTKHHNKHYHEAHTDLHETIQEVLTLLIPQTNKQQCQIHVSYDPTTPMVFMPKQQIKQVLVNVLKNSLEAMISENEQQLSIETTVLPRAVHIRVRDNGCGIKQENLVKLFTPYQTTKKYGTGLGLVICKKLMESNNGSISVESHEGKGTSIQLELPCDITVISCQPIVK